MSIGLLWRAIDAQIAANEDPEVARKRRDRMSAEYRAGQVRASLEAREDTRRQMARMGHDPDQFPALEITSLQKELAALEARLRK